MSSAPSPSKTDELTRAATRVAGRQLVSFAVFVTVMALAIGAIHFYVYQRLVRAPELAAPTTLTLGVVLIALTVLTPVGILLGRMLGPPWGRSAAWLAYVWFGTLALLLFALMFSEPLRWLAQFWLADPLRARIHAASVATVCGLAAIWATYAARCPAHIKHVHVTLDRFPSSLSGYRLVQLTDLHLGPTLGRSWLQAVVAQVNELGPDAIVITGDMVDGSVSRLADDVQPLAALQANDGVFFVTGNHEYYSGVASWIDKLTELGLQPLRNQRVALGGAGPEGFDLAGVDDYHAAGGGHGPDLDGALRDRDPQREIVLLAHQPKQVIEAARAGVGLQLSGHTHGGQLFPWGLFVRLQQPYVKGLVRLGDTQLYISCGTGYWGPPMRLGAPAEITLITLHSPAD